jgi:uncharacterized protein
VNSEYGPLLSVSHKNDYQNNFFKTKAPLAALCFNSRFAWSLGMLYRYKEVEGLSCLYCDGGEGITNPHLVFPLGDLSLEKLSRVIDFYEPAFIAQNQPIKLMFVPSDRLPLIKEMKRFDVSVENKPDYNEYVYKAADLKSLKGKSLKAKKNQLNRFYRECNACTYKELTVEDQDECLRITEEWCVDRGIDKADFSLSDYTAIRILFEHYNDLDVRAGGMWLHNKLIGFSIGTAPLDGTAFIHFEKVDHVIAGAGVAIVVAALEKTYPDAIYVNREEDMGIEGLRIAKQSYNPAYMTEKNDVFLSRK